MNSKFVLALSISLFAQLTHAMIRLSKSAKTMICRSIKPINIVRHLTYEQLIDREAKLLNHLDQQVAKMSKHNAYEILGLARSKNRNHKITSEILTSRSLMARQIYFGALYKSLGICAMYEEDPLKLKSYSKTYFSNITAYGITPGQACIIATRLTTNAFRIVQRAEKSASNQEDTAQAVLSETQVTLTEEDVKNEIVPNLINVIEDYRMYFNEQRKQDENEKLNAQIAAKITAQKREFRNLCAAFASGVLGTIGFSISCK